MKLIVVCLMVVSGLWQGNALDISSFTTRHARHLLSGVAQRVTEGVVVAVCYVFEDTFLQNYSPSGPQYMDEFRECYALLDKAAVNGDSEKIIVILKKMVQMGWEMYPYLDECYKGTAKYILDTGEKHIYRNTDMGEICKITTLVLLKAGMSLALPIPPIFMVSDIVGTLTTNTLSLLGL